MAVFQGTVIANLLDAGKLVPGVRATVEDTVLAAATILRRVVRANRRDDARLESSDSSNHQATICTWDEDSAVDDGAAKKVKQTVVDIAASSSDAEVLEQLVTALTPVGPQLAAAGGVILLVLSAVATRSVGKVIGDMAASGAEAQLVISPFHVCSSGLLNLLLIGRAEDNMSAYNNSGHKVDWGVESRIGLLSGIENELKILINDTLKFPTRPIYILHGRDHFTISFELPGSKVTRSVDDGHTEEQQFSLVHWNGLPPGGPRFSLIDIVARASVARAPAEAAQGIGIEYKPTINSIDSIVQAHPRDRAARPKQWRTWRYEVALVIDDPKNVSPELPADHARPPTFELPEEVPEAAIFPDRPDTASWRCRACYETRYQTMCFGMNEMTIGTPSDQVVCSHCGKTKKEAGWTLWLPYERLPGGWQSHVDREDGPKITPLLGSKWPGCRVEFDNPNDPPVV